MSNRPNQMMSSVRASQILIYYSYRLTVAKTRSSAFCSRTFSVAAWWKWAVTPSL